MVTTYCICVFELVTEFWSVISFSVLTLTDASLLIEVVACWTLTLETAKGVDTVSTLAETWQLLALVDI